MYILQPLRVLSTVVRSLATTAAPLWLWTADCVDGASICRTASGVKGTSDVVLRWRPVQYLPGSNFTNRPTSIRTSYSLSLFICWSFAIRPIVQLTFVLLVTVFQACSRKSRRRPRVRHAVDHIVTEATIPTDPTNDLTFGLFMKRTEEDVRRIVDDHRQRYG